MTTLLAIGDMHLGRQAQLRQELGKLEQEWIAAAEALEDALQ